MCGIAGIVGEGAAQQRDAVARMVAAQRHRGPDGEGLYLAPSGRCVLGHRRLAILDLSDAAAQPMLSPDGRFALVYNGECYNYLDLRASLLARGETFTSSGDTELMLRLLSRGGAESLARMNAMFALALWDEREGRLLLARDRFGQKPLYLARAGRLLLFASEVRALLASGLVPRQADLQGILGYLSYGALQEPQSIVAGVSPLPRASFLTRAADGTESAGVYWTPPRDRRPCPPSELRETFTAAVARHLLSDVPVGLFLSGGIDSSSIAAAAVHSSRDSVKTLCVVFPEQPEQSEAEHARLMARAAGTEHREVPIAGSEMLRMLPAALDAMDQPTIDGINTYLVSHAARASGLKVALSGLGGDELFGGYPAFTDVPRMRRLRPWLGLLGPLAPRLLGNGGVFTNSLGKVVDWLEAPPGVLNAYLVRRRLFSSRQVQALLPGLAQGAWISGLSASRLAELEALAHNRAVADAVGLLEMDMYMGQTLLRDSDVMGMAHSLEIRNPFLDADFADLALAPEPAARTPTDLPKHRFVEAMDDWLPRLITRRRKQGFSLPFADWMRRELREEVDAGIVSLARLGGPVAGSAVQEVWQRFCSEPGRINWSRPWSLFILGRYLAAHRLGF